jgi:hypothetical protein
MPTFDRQVDDAPIFPFMISVKNLRSGRPQSGLKHRSLPILFWFPSETNLRSKRTSRAGYFSRFSQGELFMKYVAIAAFTLAVAFSAAPASAAMMACTSDNMAKSVSMGATMQDGPGKMGMMKEVGMANSDMSKGKMKSACMHYMKAQKMGMMKSSMGM